ncbi:MAG: hypothetical protein CVV30_02985 [Methanomicrobiales archaeon HGW-Methanomicrobiales-1]|jgi:2-polyprenyl-3-methyl-5-hydroxy-6-metoxy-1,4-benzoquinol methylase|nr:MAG: hypothetical protein CVV30_02985 [Methanomicrobiales archaeon HGW-Methanomicrobiales-1]
MGEYTMDKFELAKLIKTSEVIEKVAFIQNRCRGKSILDLGCIRHNAEFAKKDPNWLHQKIKEVAKNVIGIDYLENEVKKLKDMGYDIRFGDVTQPLTFNERFDVIVAGDIIEHLSNFDGFFENCLKYLKDDGILIISTPNPFFTDEFHYVSFKRNYIINPEHTCWIDPQALSQLSQRYNLAITELHFIKNPWSLKNLICENENYQYDILNDKWIDNSSTFPLLRYTICKTFGIFYYLYKRVLFTNTKLVGYSDYLAVLKRSN